MRAIPGKGQEAAIFQPYEVELSFGKRVDGTGLEPVDRPRYHYRSIVRGNDSPGAQEIHQDPDGLRESYGTDPKPSHAHKAAA